MNLKDLFKKWWRKFQLTEGLTTPFNSPSEGGHMMPIRDFAHSTQA